MLALVRYWNWNQWQPPLKSDCLRCRPKYHLSLSFHTSASLHSVVWGWLLDAVKTAASASAIQHLSDTNSGVRRTIRKYTRTMAVTALVAGRLSSDHSRSRVCEIDWIHHLRIQIKLSISSSHLQLESISRHLIVWQMMRCKNYAQARISAVCRPCHLWCRYSAYMLCRLL